MKYPYRYYIHIQLKFSQNCHLDFSVAYPDSSIKLWRVSNEYYFADFSGADDITNPEFVKDLGTAMMGDFDPEMFPSDDALRQGLDPIDVDGLQMLADPTMVISDSSAEAHFRLDRL